jgi:hypothetical protein
MRHGHIGHVQTELARWLNRLESRVTWNSDELARDVEHRLWEAGPKGLGLLSNSEVPRGVDAGSERCRGKPAVRKGMQPSLALRAPSAGSVSCKGRPCSKTTGRWAQKQPSFKECVTAHQSRAWAPKMDGAKPAPDMRAHRSNGDRVRRRGVRVEVGA